MYIDDTKTKIHQSTSETELNMPTSIIDRISKELKHKTKQKANSNSSMTILYIKSLFLLLCSLMFSSFYYLSLKVNIYTKPSTSITIFIFGLSQMVISLLFCYIDNIDISLDRNFNRNDIDELLLRSFCEFLSNTMMIMTLSAMRIVSAMTVFYLSPIIKTFIVLKQKMDSIKKFDKLCYVFSFVVVIIFILQDFYERNKKENFIDDILGTVLAMITAVLSAVTSLSERKTKNEFHPYIVNFVSGIFAVSTSPILMNIQQCNFTSLSLSDCLLIFVSTVSFFFTCYYRQKYMQSGFLMSKSGVNYIVLGLAYVFSIFVLDEPVTLSDILASIIAMLVNFYSNLRLELSENEDNL